MQLAHSKRWRLLALVPCVASMGCLVTEEIVFPLEENSPPIVLNESSPTPGSVVTYESFAESLPFTIKVRDENVDQPLAYTAFIDLTSEGDFADRITGDIPPNPPERDREELFMLTRDRVGIGPACRKLDIRISSELGRDDLPVDPDDVASVVWWIDVRDATNTGANLDMCPR